MRCEDESYTQVHVLWVVWVELRRSTAPQHHHLGPAWLHRISASHNHQCVLVVISLQEIVDLLFYVKLPVVKKVIKSEGWCKLNYL